MHVLCKLEASSDRRLTLQVPGWPAATTAVGFPERQLSDGRNKDVRLDVGEIDVSPCPVMGTFRHTLRTGRDEAMGERYIKGLS